MQPTGGGGGYSVEAQTLFAAMTSEPDSTRKRHINTLIAALKTGGGPAVAVPTNLSGSFTGTLHT